MWTNWNKPNECLMPNWILYIISIISDWTPSHNWIKSNTKLDVGSVLSYSFHSTSAKAFQGIAYNECSIFFKRISPNLLNFFFCNCDSIFLESKQNRRNGWMPWLIIMDKNKQISIIDNHDLETLFTTKKTPRRKFEMIMEAITALSAPDFI